MADNRFHWFSKGMQGQIQDELAAQKPLEFRERQQGQV
jgi:hypothetical protein